MLKVYSIKHINKWLTYALMTYIYGGEIKKNIK